VMLSDDFVRSSLPVRPDNAHKGTFGTCLVVAGSTPYVGAAFLTGKAAYRSGCGLVNMACLSEVYDGLAGKFPETIWSILPDVDGSYDLGGIPILQNSFLKADAMVIGPGWGLSEENLEFLKDLLSDIPKNLPAVFDADGLKLLKQIDNWWNFMPLQTVLTPHPGEMALLTDLKIGEIQKNRWEIAAEYAKKWQVTIILKGALSVIALPDGQIFINPFSNAALATAGSGDVLAGVIGGLLAQGSHVHLAAICGVYIHALAGIGASHEFQSDVSVTALDILDYVGSAISRIKKTG
jgi:ADP-dependent NAD(P)H-hydrate dehydratase / NAD(P)H-hydrate epimerase